MTLCRLIIVKVYHNKKTSYFLMDIHQTSQSFLIVFFDSLFANILEIGDKLFHWVKHKGFVSFSIVVYYNKSNIMKK
jgi:hypothetical protein